MRPFAAALLLLIASPALADDFYVDAVNGNDGASGRVGDPWRTMTFSLSQISTGAHTLHVATGVYDTDLGEVFPLRPAPGLAIVGEGDAMVVSPSNIYAFLYQPPSFGSLVLDTLRLRGGHGVRIFTDWGDASGNVTLRNLDVSVSGTFVDGEYAAFLAGGSTVTVENCWVYDGGPGFVIDQWDCANTFTFDIRDSVFERLSLGLGESNSAGYRSTITFTRCSFMDLSSSAASVEHTTLTLDSCLVANCGAGVSAGGGYWDSTIVVRGSTIVGSIGAGVRNDNVTSIVDSILWDNGDDIDASGSVSVIRSNIEDGDFVGQNGNISADPLFRDPAAGDYRLSFGSPGIEAANTPGLDRAGFPRDSDGDLNTTYAADMGAYELRTLEAPPTARIGRKLHLDALGEPGQYAVFYLARTTPLTVPDPTPFGRRWLPQAQLELLGTHKILSPSGVRHTVYLPSSQALVGLTFGFQALTRSTVAPAGAAWSDVVAVEFRP